MLGQVIDPVGEQGHLDFRRSCDSFVGREFLDYAFIGFISEWGVWGYPTYGTAEKGEKLTEQRVEQIVAWTKETFCRVETLRQGAE